MPIPLGPEVKILSVHGRGFVSNPLHLKKEAELTPKHRGIDKLSGWTRPRQKFQWHTTVAQAGLCDNGDEHCIS
jgi:hypothetical protein